MLEKIDRKDCPMRHENGNCTVAGGFCTAVNDAICEALHNAFRCGEDAERDRTVLMLADINEKYAQRNLKVLKQIHEKVTAPVEELQEELDKYKKAEAEGLAIYPPCKVGETIYRIIDDCLFPAGGTCGQKRACAGCEYRNLFIEEDVFHLCLLTDKGQLQSGYYTTKEEAMAAIAKKQGKEGSGDGEMHV